MVIYNSHKKEVYITRMTYRKNKKIFIAIQMILIISVMSISLSGCDSSTENTKEKKDIVLTTGFKANEVFKIEDMNCLLPETLVYLCSVCKKYSAVYGNDIFETTVDGVSMKDNLKDNVIADISQIKAMNILAKRSDIDLDTYEIELVNKAKNDYFALLSSYEIDFLGIDEDIVYTMYYEYALADKLYKTLIRDINPEISDDDARTITVQHIFIKTYVTDGTGEKIEYSEDAKEIAYEKAQMIREYALDGEHDFLDLVSTYSDGELGDYSFCIGDTEPEFEQAAFNLGKDEISEVVETKYGYHIIKCINTFNREETDLNKIKLQEKEREAVFGVQYDEFAKTLLTYMNDELWDSVEMITDENVNAQNFFEIYHKYFN